MRLIKVLMSLPAHLREQIRDLLPLRAKLVLVSEQCEKRILDQRVQERDELRALKRECQRLQRVIESMRGQQTALQIQVEFIYYVCPIVEIWLPWIIHYSKWLKDVLSVFDKCTVYRLMTSMISQ